MNILTFDIEEWYIYQQYKKGPPSYFEPILERYLEEILDLLEKQNITATFYCLGVVAKNHPHIVKKIASRNHEIGSHSFHHHWITKLTPEEFYEDTKQSKIILEDILGLPVIHYRAPAFSITQETSWATSVLYDLGFQTDSSIFPAQRNFGGFSQLNYNTPFKIACGNNLLKEFPINFKKVWNKKIMYSGGGYFRMLPYFYVSNAMKQSSYNMAYFHLRDIDKYQKRVYSSRYLHSYIGVNSAFQRLKRLINEFDFISIGEAEKQVNWKNTPILSMKSYG